MKNFSNSLYFLSHLTQDVSYDMSRTKNNFASVKNFCGAVKNDRYQ